MAYKPTKILIELFASVASEPELMVATRLYNERRKGSSNAYMLKVIKKHWYKYIKPVKTLTPQENSGFNKIALG